MASRTLAPPVTAQASQRRRRSSSAASRFRPASNEYLPVGVVGQPVRVDVTRPVKIETDRPIKIEADRALKVENVGYIPAQKPGE